MITQKDNNDTSYNDFIDSKSQLDINSGFEPVFMPDFLFDFQEHLIRWAVKKGRAAIFSDCGTGIELKPSYYKQSIRNMKNAFLKKPKQQDLFS